MDLVLLYYLKLLKMNKKIFYLLSFLFLISCGSGNKSNYVGSTESPKKVAKNGARPKAPILNVYNMGGVPPKDVSELVKALQKIYPNTKFAGELSFVDSAYIKNDPKGKNRYWWSKLRPHLIKTTDTKHYLTLVIVNAEVCNWDAKTKGSHANLGMSNCGGHVSTISYQRLKVNHLNNANDMMKVVIHELGHSVARLVIEREDLRFHCPDASCLMRDANNGFPYRGLISFCPSCSKAMRAKGFNLSALKLKK